MTAQGIKKSNFPAKTTGFSAATFDYVLSGVNYKIPFSDLLTALGATGSMAQAGNPTATPVLDIQGAVNNIRNLEAGSGVQTSISALNGIAIAHNFQQEGTGTAIVDDIAGASPEFVSLLPGSGIQIASAAGVLTISATGALPTTKVVTVNQESDFPTASGGIITLEADTVYIIANNITTANRFVLSNNTTVTGYSVLSPTLTYSGSATMFTGVDASITMSTVHFDCPNAQFIDLTDTVGGVKEAGFDNVLIASCDSIGTVADYDVFFASVFVCRSIATQGLLLSGANYTLIDIDTNSLFSTDAGFIGIDLGTSVSQSIEIINLFASGVAGAVGIAGAAGSANLTATGFGDITNCKFIGDIAPLADLTHDDLQWEFLGNQGIEDTNQDSLSTNTAGATVTISAPGTAVKVAGTWVDDNSSQFTVDGTGRTTYNGVKTLHVPITAGITAYPVSGSNKDFTVYVAINGTIVAESGRVSKASSSDKPSVTVIWQHAFEDGHYVEVFLANDTDTVNFTVDHAIMRIN